MHMTLLCRHSFFKKGISIFLLKFISHIKCMSTSEFFFMLPPKLKRNVDLRKVVLASFVD